LVDRLQAAHRRWPGGIYALWYPIKDRAAALEFRKALRRSGIPKIVDVTFEVRAPSSEPRLDGSGMVIVNPPYTLEAELRVILPALKAILGEAGAVWDIERLSGENADS
jgi:23S rRNA (adenine2030-N6)-methyltransferase